MFNITILQDTLMTILTYLEPTVGNNNTNMGDDCLYMESLTTGSCIFYTTNTIEASYIEAICSKVASNDKAPYVEFKRFKGIVSTISPSEYITLTDSGKNELLISFSMKKVPIKLSGNTNGMLPLLPIFNNQPNDMYEVSPSFLRNASTKASNIIQDSVSNTLMNCVKFTIGGQDLIAEAMDINTKRTFYMSETNYYIASPKSFYLEASKLTKALKMFEDFLEIEIGSENNATLVQLVQGTGKNVVSKHYTVDIIDIKYAVREMVGLFPNIAQYYSNNYLPTEYITVNKNDLLKSIKRFHAIENNTLPAVLINVSNYEFNFKYSTIYGEVDDLVDTDNHVTTPFSASFDCRNLESIVKNIQSDFIDIGKMQNTQANFIIKGSNTGNNQYNEGDMYTILALNGQQTP